jgi:hypothetical protein
LQDLGFPPLNDEEMRTTTKVDAMEVINLDDMDADTDDEDLLDDKEEPLTSACMA